MDPYVESLLNWRLIGEDDLLAVTDLREQLEALDNSVLYGMADQVLDLAPRFAEGMAVGGWDAYSSLMAYGLGYVDESGGELRIYLTGGVHPTRRNRAIGSHLLAWQVKAAIAWRDEHRPGVPARLGCYAELGRPSLEGVARRQGFTPERFFFDLQRDLERPVALLNVPGVSIEPFDLTESAAVLALHQECFQAVADAEAAANWHERLQQPDFRPQWSFVARHEGRLVGYAMSGEEVLSDGERLGWTERFGVHPEFRSRGIALALLSHTLEAMRAAGCAEAGIGVDTDHSAGIDRLSRELGYTTRDAIALLSKVV